MVSACLSFSLSSLLLYTGPHFDGSLAESALIDLLTERRSLGAFPGACLLSVFSLKLPEHGLVHAMTQNQQSTCSVPAACSDFGIMANPPRLTTRICRGSTLCNGPDPHSKM